MDNNHTNPPSAVAEFYRNKSVFVTGATGFLGKATVEKLLRSCPEVEKIYVLMRPKSGSDILCRLNQLLDGTLFETLRSVNPTVLAKVIAVAGDISQPCLGLSEDDQDLLIQRVSVVIHSAATVKFNETLKCAMNLNFHGTERVIELCKRMNLVALIHVSTAYAHCERQELTETIYPAAMDPRALVKRLETLSEAESEVIKPEIIGEKPNTYTFTKALVETILSEASSDLPITIIRPSIVTATWREPIPGFVDNINGATGFGASVGTGMLRTFFCRSDVVADYIPLDITVKLIISSAWATTLRNGTTGIAVYNCCTGAENPVLYSRINQCINKYWSMHPPSKVYWTPSCSITSNRAYYVMNDFIWHYVPFACTDVYTKLRGGNPRMLRIHRKMKAMTGAFQYFTTREWNFKTDNMVALNNVLSPNDKVLFNCDVKEIDWEDYLDSYMSGIRTHILKEDVNKVQKARLQLKRIQWAYKIIQLTTFFTFVFILLGILHVKEVFHQIL